MHKPRFYFDQSLVVTCSLTRKLLECLMKCLMEARKTKCKTSSRGTLNIIQMYMHRQSLSFYSSVSSVVHASDHSDLDHL